MASRPSSRAMVIGPCLVSITTWVMPGPSEVCRSTGTLSRSLSQATSRSALGLIRSAETDARVTLSGCWSRAAASSARHGREPGPAEVGVAGGVGLALAQHHRRLAAVGGRRVGDPALGQRPERVVRRVVRRLGRPPDRDGGVGQQQRQHHRLGVPHDLALEPDQRGLATPAAAGGDGRVDLGLAPAVAEDHAEHPRRVLARGPLGGLHRGLGVVVGHDDDQRHHHAHGRGPGAGPGPDELGGDRGGVGVLELELGHGRLQVRPSRASILSADSGPQVPDG